MQLPYRQHLFPAINDRQLQWLAALLSLAAAGVHFAVAPEHFAEYWLFGWFFLALAWLQALWAVAITSRPSRGLLIAGLAGNVFIVVIWLWTRTVGVPFGPGAGETEAFGWPDGLSVILELGVAALALLLILPVRRGDARSPSILLVTLISSVLLVAVVGVALSRASEPEMTAGTPTLQPMHHR